MSIAAEWTRSREAGHPISEAGMFAAGYCYNLLPEGALAFRARFPNDNHNSYWTEGYK